MSEKSICGSMPWLNRFMPERDQADVAGALAVAEQAALDAVGAGHVAQLGGGDGGAAVVVRVQATARRESRRRRLRCIHSIESA